MTNDGSLTDDGPARDGQASGDPVSIQQKVEFLSRCDAFPQAPAAVEVIETHMSWVFLAGDRVYKLKKPIKYDFLDFSSIDKRRRAVFDEVRLNRRLARDVYLAAIPLTRAGPDGMALGDQGQVVDWLVEMRRLPDALTLEAFIAAGGPKRGHVIGVARLLAGFYGGLRRQQADPEAYRTRFADEIGKTRQVLTDPDLWPVGPELSAALADCDTAFAAAAPVMRDRAGRGYVREGHGDLRPQHVFLTDPPVIIDCIEFNRNLRLVDPLDEAIFLGMECAHLGAEWITGDLIAGLDGAIGAPPPVLAEFYWRYRALLRARLSLLHLVLQPGRTPERWRPLARDYVALSARPELIRRQPADPAPAGSGGAVR